MLARVAENLYWMARYMERAEDTARLIDATSSLLLDMPRGATFGWDALIKVAGLDQFRKFYSVADEANVMRFLLTDERNPSSIVNCISLARENNRTFREVLPRETWELTNEMYLFAKANLVRALEPRQRYEILQGIIRRRQALVGIVAGSMSQDAAYAFFLLGRNLERADMTSRIIDVSYAVLLPEHESGASPFTNLLWMGQLKALSAYQMYRRHVAVDVRGRDMLTFLFRDPLFPRSVAHCLDQLARAWSGLPGKSNAKEQLRADAVSTCIQDARATIANADFDALAERGLHEFIDGVQVELSGIHDALAAAYFRFEPTFVSMIAAQQS